MIFFGYDVEKPPYVTYSVVNSAGNLILSQPITIPVPGNNTLSIFISF
jgi:hypothetical protein